MSSTVPKTYSSYVLPYPGAGLDGLRLVQGQPTPLPANGQVLVAIKAVSLNYRDHDMVRGQYPAPVKDDLVPCSDAAGEVVAIGEGVRSWKVGDRVMSQFTQDQIAGPFDTPDYFESCLGGGCDGVLTEYKAFAAQGLVKIPAHLSYEEAATLPCAALTAWNAIFGSDSGAPSLLPGQTVVLQGTGGVSVFGAQLARLAGASVIITSSSDIKLKTVVDHINSSQNFGGVAPIHTINYSKQPEWDQEVLRVTEGRGADFVLEIGGAGTLERSFSALKQGGVVATIGYVSAVPSSLPNAASLALLKSAFLRGILIGSRRQFQQMSLAIDQSKLRPLISQIYAFEDARLAFKEQFGSSSGAPGKAVIRVSQ